MIYISYMNSGDSIVDSVIQKFLQRSALGQEKYGVTLDHRLCQSNKIETHGLPELRRSTN